MQLAHLWCCCLVQGVPHVCAPDNLLLHAEKLPFKNGALSTFFNPKVKPVITALSGHAGCMPSHQCSVLCNQFLADDCFDPGCTMQTPISIFQRFRKDGAKVLKETLGKTKLWIPGYPHYPSLCCLHCQGPLANAGSACAGNNGWQTYKQARTLCLPGHGLLCGAAAEGWISASACAQSVQQGGTLILQGKSCIFAFYNESTAAHITTEELLDKALNL